jgi:hypothetical protein
MRPFNQISKVSKENYNLLYITLALQRWRELFYTGIIRLGNKSKSTLVRFQIGKKPR